MCLWFKVSVQKYLNKNSEPLLDRIDIHLEVVSVPFNKLAALNSSENSEAVRERVIKARQIQALRFENNKGVYANAQMNSKKIRKYVVLDEAGSELIKKAMDKLGLSARAYDRILKVARTIADLDECKQVMSQHLSEAIHYRSLDRESWGG